jgi:general secretion pathway protein G
MRAEARRIVKLAALLIGALVMLALLTTPAIYKLSGDVEYRKHVRITSDIQALHTALHSYKERTGTFPKTDRGLASLGLSELPRDPWANQYIYRCPGIKNFTGYDLFSAGPDRTPDTADDDWGE